MMGGNVKRRSLRVLPPSKVPQLGRDEDENAKIAVDWFFSNYIHPDGVLEWSDFDNDYVWTKNLGPFSAREALAAFRGSLHPDEVQTAIERIEATGVTKWTAALHRVVSPNSFAPDMKRSRPRSGDVDRTENIIVETVFYPVRDMRWTVHATFVPGVINADLGSEVSGDRDLTIKKQRFRSIRGMISSLHRYELSSAKDTETRALAEASIAWIKTLKDDSELFVQHALVVHGSPPGWLPVKALGPTADGAAITAIVLSSPGLGSAAMLMLAYGGGRIFLRLVRNVNYTQDALFERVQRRIRRGDWEPFKD